MSLLALTGQPTLTWWITAYLHSPHPAAGVHRRLATQLNIPPGIGGLAWFDPVSGPGLAPGPQNNNKITRKWQENDSFQGQWCNPKYAWQGIWCHTGSIGRSHMHRRNGGKKALSNVGAAERRLIWQYIITTNRSSVQCPDKFEEACSVLMKPPSSFYCWQNTIHYSTVGTGCNFSKPVRCHLVTNSQVFHVLPHDQAWHDYDGWWVNTDE